MKQRIRLAALALAALVSLAGSSARAATFTVNPTQIFLSGSTTTALLTVKNESDETLRFQLTAFGWQQAPNGEVQLTATQDVVFFPALLTLGPKEERRIRVGSTVPAAAQERTYRIFVEELPPQSTQTEKAAVRVLTKMGVPIFIRPGKDTATATLRDLGMRAGSLHFAVANSGTVHFVPEKIFVRGAAADGKRVLERELQGWYILAGGVRDFEVPISAADCSGIRTFEVTVEFNATSVKETLQAPAGACSK